MRFGERLKDILDSKGMSQAELSRLSGIDEGYISKIITDKAAAGRRTIDKMAEALNIPVTALYDDEIAIRELVDEAIRELSPETINFIRAQKNGPWLALAKDLSTAELTPDQIKKVVELWKETVSKSIP